MPLRLKRPRQNRPSPQTRKLIKQRRQDLIRARDTRPVVLTELGRITLEELAAIEREAALATALIENPEDYSQG